MTSSSSKPFLRFLLIVENLPVPFDRRVWQQACALRDAGHQVTVICPAGRGYPSGDHHLDGIRVRRHTLPVEASGAWGYLVEYGWALACETWLALRSYRSEGFDVVQVANPPDLLWSVAWPYKLLGIPLVYDQHDLAPELYRAKFDRDGWMVRVLQALERRSYRTADQVLSTNASFRERALASGLPEGRVTVVRNGPDLNRLRRLPPREELKRGAAHLLVYVGLMGPQEGLEDLLVVMRLLRDTYQRNDVHLVLAGDGPVRAAQERRAADWGLDQRVTFTGMLTDEDLVPLLNTADVCLAPDPKNSMNDRSTMLKVMEYMAVGKPIVQYDLKEGRATAGEAAVYARPGDVAHFAGLVQQLLEDPGTRRRMGDAGARRVDQELCWSRQAPRYVSVLESLAGFRSGESS